MIVADQFFWPRPSASQSLRESVMRGIDALLAADPAQRDEARRRLESQIEMLLASQDDAWTQMEEFRRKYEECLRRSWRP